MAQFRIIVERLREKILSFRGMINIVICHLDLDSLAAAIAMKYYVSCILGDRRRINIFYNGDLNNPLIRAVCEHFQLLSREGMKSVLDFHAKGDHIFIDFKGHLGKKFRKVKPAVIIGDVETENLKKCDMKMITFGSPSDSSSSAVLHIIDVSGNSNFSKNESKYVLELLAVAIRYDAKKHNLVNISDRSAFARILRLAGGLEQSISMFDELPLIISRAEKHSS